MASSSGVYKFALFNGSCQSNAGADEEEEEEEEEAQRLATRADATRPARALSSRRAECRSTEEFIVY